LEDRAIGAQQTVPVASWYTTISQLSLELLALPDLQMSTLDLGEVLTHRRRVGAEDVFAARAEVAGRCDLGAELTPRAVVFQHCETPRLVFRELGIQRFRDLRSPEVLLVSHERLPLSSAARTISARVR